MNLPNELETRFVRYAKIDTQSDSYSKTAPSTEKQYDLLRLLVEELEETGASDVRLTEYGCVLVTIPATTDTSAPTIALLAHVDTAPQFTGKDVKPIVHRNYDGSTIVLPDDETQQIDPERFPYLLEKIGDDVITASGKSLLGADDKAGVAIIMTLANHLLQNPEIEHGRLRICFTPDEEIGRGVVNLTKEDLDAEIAYTLDGGKAGQVTYETWSADGAEITITGVSTHPGYSKDRMVDAKYLMAEFITRLPHDHSTPWTTDGREGFIWVNDIVPETGKTVINLILRDYELEGLTAHRATIDTICEQFRLDYPECTIEWSFSNQYRNMRYWLENDMRLVQYVRDAIEAVGLPVINTAARGGTDGSRLTEMGVPTPDIFTGMQNYHGPLEWVSLQDMEKSVLVCAKMVQLWAES